MTHTLYSCSSPIYWHRWIANVQWILNNNQQICVKDRTSTMQRPCRQGQQKNSLKQSTTNPPSFLFLHKINWQLWVSAVYNIMPDRSEANTFFDEFYLKRTNLSRHRLTALQQHNQWSRDWMCHLLFTHINIFFISSSVVFFMQRAQSSVQI